MKEFNKVVNGYKIKGEIYSSANEVVDLLKTRPITDSKFYDMSKNLAEHSSGWARWCGVSSYDEALEMLRNGFQETTEILKKELKNVKSNNHKRISTQNNISGFAPIVPLALLGVPKNMMDTYIKPIKSKIIDVFYDITSSASVKSSEIIDTGRKVLGAIMKLEKEGYKINLYAVQMYGDNKDADIIIIKIKDSKLPIDLKRISYPLTHTSFFRVIGFDWYSRFPQGRYRSGYGTPLYLKKSKKELIDIITRATNSKNAIVFNGSEIRNETIEQIIDNMKK